MSPMIRTLSYNIHFGKKLPNIIAWLKSEPRADIYCFQEFPQDRIREFVRALPGPSYTWRFAPALRVRKKIFGELTAMTNPSIRLTSSSVVTLPTNKMDRLTMGKHSQRSCLITTCMKSRKRFIVANMQLSCVANTAVRHGQLDKIIAVLTRRRTRRAILIGDFNSWTISERKRLIAYMKLHQFTTHEPRTATHRISIYKQQLDFVFGKNCVVGEVAVSRVRYSDHYPVHAAVRL